jgi:hypothetical protein
MTECVECICKIKFSYRIPVGKYEERGYLDEMHFRVVLNGKVNQLHYRPEQAQGFQKVEAPKFQDNLNMKMARWSVLSTCLPPLSHRNYSWYSFLLEAELTPGP